MAAATHHALAEALSREPLETIPASRPQSPAPPRLQLSLSSPFMDKVDLLQSMNSPETGRCSTATAPSFHTAKSHSEVDGRRPRPTPITIPQDDESHPRFSLYPLTGDGQESQRGKQAGRSVAVRKSSLSLASRPIVPPPPSAAVETPSWEPPATLRMSSDSVLSVSRHRSLSTLGLVKRAQDRSAQFGKPGSPTCPPHKRRSSLGSGEFDIVRWREMGSVAQFDRNLPYGYGRSDLGLKPTAATSEPTPSFDAPLPLSIDTEAAFVTLEKLKIARDEVPPRSSSLIYDTNAVLPDNASIVSMSDPSLSSPSNMSKSLPSTKTSLSRSVRSGKESEEADAKRAETAQVLLEKRRMILLEIVETEISYVHALRALVHIYLPHLAVLPQLSGRSHSVISRNSADLLEFHTQLAAHMVEILKSSGVGYDCCAVDALDRVTRELVQLFVREATSFGLYNDYCAGSMPATAAVRDVADRVDYEIFEKRCQYISSATPQATLKEILASETPQPCRVRLRFKDILIAPIQRVCRYPLLLASLLADVHQDSPPSDVLSTVESGLAVMRNVAANADDARQRLEAELKTAAVLERIESHPAVTHQLLKQLGTCRLIGALDVMYHHSVHAPLDRPAKVKYLAAFLYRGYLILAKPKRVKFEVRHYLPLEVLEIIDIKEGCLPFSIRLAIRDHTFDLSATCEAEKELWAAELSSARDESTISPFELPSSVSLFAPRSRHGSTNSRLEIQQNRTPSKRYSMLNLEVTPSKQHTASDFSGGKRASVLDNAEIMESPEQSPVEVLNWDYRQSQPSTMFVQRPSLATRLQVDRVLCDVVSESLATARSRTQLQHSIPDRRSTLLDPKLRRRRSIAEMRPVDVIESPEVRGAVINGDRPQSLLRARSFVMEGAKREAADISRNSSFSSITDLGMRLSRRSSLSRSGLGLEAIGLAPRSEASQDRSQHRRAMSTSSVSRAQRARSVPPTPIEELDSSPFELASSDTNIDEASKQQHKRADSADSYVHVPYDSPSLTVRKSKSIRRSLSFFSRRLSDCDGDEVGSAQSSPLNSSSGSATPPRAGTAPNTPDASPQTPRRRRSVRLLGQLRGFTPI